MKFEKWKNKLTQIEKIVFTLIKKSKKEHFYMTVSKNKNNKKNNLIDEKQILYI